MPTDELTEIMAEAIADPKRNPHGLSIATVSNRHRRLGWTLEEALSVPKMNRSQASSVAAKKSPWKAWDPGRFSEADLERRKNEPDWKLTGKK